MNISEPENSIFSTFSNSVCNLVKPAVLKQFIPGRCCLISFTVTNGLESASSCLCVVINHPVIS